MKVSADRWNGRLDCGQTREKIYQDCLNNFLKIFKHFLFIFLFFYRQAKIFAGDIISRNKKRNQPFSQHS